MKKQKHSNKFLKRGVLTLALLLGLGLLVMTGIQPSYGIAAESTITATSASTTTGTVTGGGTYYEGDTVNLVATPKSGYRFVNWTEGATVASTDAAYTFVATASSRTLVAHFQAISTPVITGGISMGYDSVKIDWGAVAGAASYDVYYTTSAAGSYVKADTVTGTSYIKTGLTTGKAYYFKVMASCVAGSTITYSNYSAYKVVTPIPGTSVATVASASYTGLKVSWTAVPGASAYAVYRATSATGTYTYIGALTSTTFTNNGLVTGKTYYYKIRAYKTVGTTKVYGAYSAYKYGKPVPGTATLAAVPRTMTSTKVAWTAVTGATKYLVYRATSATGTYSLIYTGASTARSYIDTGRTNGATYYYKVRTCHLEGTVYVYGGFSAIKSVKVGSSYAAGKYKVGADIPAGEYLLNATSAVGGSYVVSTDLAGLNVVAEGDIDPNLYLSVKTGQYVAFYVSTAYPVAQAPLVTTDNDGNLMAKQYKVGRDIPAGTYVLFPSEPGYSTLYIEKDAYNLASSIVGYNDFTGRCYVTVSNGEYLTVMYAMGYAAASAPPVDTTPGYVADGMYLVGTDIPAGTYTISPQAGYEDYAYIDWYSDTLHRDASFVDGLWIDSDYSVTLEAGEYIQMAFCNLYLK